MALVPEKPGWFNTWKLMDVIKKHNKNTKDKTYKIISINVENALDKQHTQQANNKQKPPQYNKSRACEPTINIILNRQRLKAFCLRSGNIARRPILAITV